MHASLPVEMSEELMEGWQRNSFLVLFNEEADRNQGAKIPLILSPWQVVLDAGQLEILKSIFLVFTLPHYKQDEQILIMFVPCNPFESTPWMTTMTEYDNQGF